MSATTSMKSLTAVLSILTICQLAIADSAHGYKEYLNITPLPRNTLLASFFFESFSDQMPMDELFSIPDKRDEHIYSQYTMFPRSLGQLIEQSNTHELHLRFSQGWWDQESWGIQPDNGSLAGGIGVELWAWVEGQNVEDAEAHWKKLVNALSGLFCASLNFIDSAHTTFPVKSFEPSGRTYSATTTKSNLYLLHGALPREPVCTENLTPFIKLLPCKGKAGISSLLDGHKLFDAQWQGMAIDVVPDCDENTNICRRRMTQKIDAVIDIPRALSRRFSPVPTPVPEHELRCDSSKPYSSQYQCFPLGESTEVNWTLSDIFGRKIAGACPLADNEFHVSFEGSDTWNVKMVTPEDDSENQLVLEKVNFSLQGNQVTDVEVTSMNSSNIPAIQSPPVFLERSFTGYGQDRGGLRSIFTNPSENEEVRFVYFETLPWYMRLYLHTLELTVRHSPVKELSKADVIKEILYRPAVDRKQPSQIELEMMLPPKTSVAISYDFDKTLLFISEYPPDANRGFDIPPGILTTIGRPFTIRTTSLLLSLPTPDFSMPYNVIILTCTVLALCFGTMFNMLVKRIVTDEEAEEAAAERPLNRIIAKVKAIIKKKLDKPVRGPFPYVDIDKNPREPSKSEYKP